jgi:SAM-dependent methyltransferase
VERLLEPEVMDAPAQALAYARADFAAVNQGFVDGFLTTFPGAGHGAVLDLGCGPADIPIRLARVASAVRVIAVDASFEMLRLAREAVARAGLPRRVRLVCARLPALPLGAAAFDAVISNSLVHHLPVPGPFWETVRVRGRPGAAVYVMDLCRPDSAARARAIVEAAAGDEDPILKQDFFNSLLAAFTVDEVRTQLAAAGLAPFTCGMISERHWLVTGRL